MNRSDIKKLQEYKGYPSISILVPTHRKMPERLQDPIKVKDLIGKAFDKLLQEFEKRDILNIIESFDRLANSIDYTQALDGLALFVNKDIAIAYYLPFHVDEQVIIDAQFSTRELTRALNRNPYYWVLALSHKPTRLFHAVGSSAQEVIDSPELRNQLKGFPYELNYDVTNDKKLQAVSAGDKDARYLTDLDIRFMDQVDHLLAPHLHEHPEPLIILGVHQNRALFEKATKHKESIIAQAEGDFSKATTGEVMHVAAQLMQDYLAHERRQAIKLFEEAIGTNHASAGLQPVWRMAKEGRVRILLVEEGYHVPGIINPDNQENLIVYEQFNKTQSNDVIDDLIEQVLYTHGAVLFVPAGSLKTYEQVAALLRY